LVGKVLKHKNIIPQGQKQRRTLWDWHLQRYLVNFNYGFATNL